MSAELASAFSLFWADYPKKVKKIAAQDAFRWAFQHFNADGALLARMLATIAWQRDFYSGPRWWPDPDKWILGQRWEDEPIVADVVPTARERADFRTWKFALGPIAAGVELGEWVRRQRRSA